MADRDGRLPHDVYLVRLVTHDPISYSTLRVPKPSQTYAGGSLMITTSRIAKAVWASLALSSCSWITGPSEPTLTLQGRFQGDSIFVMLSNEGPGPAAFFSCSLQLEEDGGMWHQVEWAPQYLGCIPEAHTLRDGDSWSLGVPISDSLSSGTYRWTIQAQYGKSNRGFQVTSETFQLEGR